MEQIKNLFYKRLNESDFKKIYGFEKPENGGGQTYIEAAGIKSEDLDRFLEFAEKTDPSNKKETRLTYAINAKVLGGEESQSIIFQPRTNRKNYKINKQNLDNTHPAWTTKNGFPEPEKDSDGKYVYGEGDWEKFKGITIYIISTTYNKYYAGFFKGFEFPSSWSISSDYNDYLKKHKVGVIFLEDKKYVFKNNKSSPFGDQLQIISCNLRTELIQEIHFGAPGTGKSHSISKIIGDSYEGYKDSDDNPFVFRITIHNEYSYFDFIGNVMPTTNSYGKIDYTFIPGLFTQALDTALSNSTKDIYFVIEEMSRGNIASIFGDIFQLLDRKSNGESEYHINNELIYNALSKESKLRLTKNKIYLPSNLHIIGTVNTSDQNVNVIDTAFKRRFDFVYEQVKPKTKQVKQENGKVKTVYLNSYKFKLGEKSYEWNDFYQKLNRFIVDQNNGLGLSEDKQLGQFFIKFDVEKDKRNFKSIKNKVLHFLWEDVQQVSMTDRKIFNHDISSFSDLYDKFDSLTNENEIFSQEFISFK